MGKSKAKAVWDACNEIAFPKLLILLCILAAFVPAFLMTGIPGAMFRPLALAISFSMITSFILSQTFVPVMASWLIKPKKVDNDATKENRFDKLLRKSISKLLPARKGIILLYLFLLPTLLVLLFQFIGKDVLPQSNSSQFQIRLIAEEGTRIEKTEDKVRDLISELETITGKENIRISSSFIGQHSSTFAVSPVYLYNSGPHEATIQIALNKKTGDIDNLKEQLRAAVKVKMPDVKIIFEPMELTEKVLSQGAETPIEVRVSGMMKKRNEMYAEKLLNELKKIDYLRDVGMPQSRKYPALSISVDRIRAAQLGIDMADVSASLIPATSSSRFTNKNFWVGGMMNMAYNVQVQVPLDKMTSKEELENLPISKSSSHRVLGDIAEIKEEAVYGETFNQGSMAFTKVIANIHEKDLGTALSDVEKAIDSLGELPKGLNIEIAGLGPVLQDTQKGLREGLIIAIIIIFLLLAANFQSFKLASVVLSGIPAVIVGSLAILMITGSRSEGRRVGKAW